MNLYTKEQTSTIHNQTFAYLEVKEEDHVLTITLDRENRRNALHPQMVVEIAYAMNYASHSNNVWVVVIQAKGRIFCAGGDLKAMAGIIEPNNSTIPKPFFTKLVFKPSL